MNDKLIEEMARSDAEFDGRPFDNLGRADRDRYIARAAKSLSVAFPAIRDICAESVEAWANENLERWKDNEEMLCDAKARAWDATAIAKKIRALSLDGIAGEPVPQTQKESDITVVEEIAAERARQISAEGFITALDDGYVGGELQQAECAYIIANEDPEGAAEITAWLKVKDSRRNLIKSAALIVAEIERIDRATLSATSANLDVIEKYAGGDAEFRFGNRIVTTPEGSMKASPIDWIVKGVKD